MKILIAGDLAPLAPVDQLFKAGDTRALFGSHLDIIQESDLFVFNLETPLCSNPDNKFMKLGRCLSASPSTIKGFPKGKKSLANIANNHIMDQGRSGLLETIDVLRNNQIDHIGAGFDDLDVGMPKEYECNGVKLGILSFADRHFSEWDAELKQGVNPVYLPKIIRDIFNLKARCDHVIVILHNGVEMYPYPTPRNQDLCRLLIEQGASIVMCQHSHVAGCCEKHKGGTIIYGQGNLIFPSNTNEEAWWSGMLVSITIDRSNKLDVEFVPYMRSRDNSCFLLDKARDDVYDEFIKRSEAIKQLGFLDEKWREFVQSHLKEKIFHSIFDGRSFRSRWSLWFSRQLMRIFPNFKMSQSKTLWWLHHMRSDDERELMESILRSNLKGHN